MHHGRPSLGVSGYDSFGELRKSGLEGIDRQDCFGEPSLTGNPNIE